MGARNIRIVEAVGSNPICSMLETLDFSRVFLYVFVEDFKHFLLFGYYLGTVWSRTRTHAFIREDFGCYPVFEALRFIVDSYCPDLRGNPIDVNCLFLFECLNSAMILIFQQYDIPQILTFTYFY